MEAAIHPGRLSRRVVGWPICKLDTPVQDHRFAADKGKPIALVTRAQMQEISMTSQINTPSSLSRRRFLKVCGTSSVGMLLVACGVTPTPIATPVPVNKALPTNQPVLTMTPSATPTATPTAAPTATLTATPIAVGNGEWTSRINGGVFHDASQAYQFVGSMNDEHKHLLDFTVGALNVGVRVKENLISAPLSRVEAGNQVHIEKDSAKLTKLKDQYATDIMRNASTMEGVWDQIMAARNAIANRFLEEVNKDGFSSFYVIIEDGKTSQIIFRKKDVQGKGELVRYKMDSSAKLVDYAEFELHSHARLEARDGRFWQGGKAVVLRGAVLNHFFFRDGYKRSTILRDIDTLVRMGSNHADFYLNAARFNDAQYLDDLKTAITYAHDTGLTVKTSFHSDGFDAQGEPMQVTVADGSKLSRNIETFFAKPQMLAVIDHIDIVNPLSEPLQSPSTDGQFHGEWDVLKPGIEQGVRTVKKIFNEETGKDVTVFYSGMDYGGNGTPCFQDPIRIPNCAIEVHPYQYYWKDGKPERLANHPEKWQRPDVEAYLDLIRRTGIPLDVGEMGYYEYLDSQLVDRRCQLMNKNGISGAFYAVDSNRLTNDPKYVVNYDGQTNMGDLMLYYNNA